VIHPFSRFLSFVYLIEAGLLLLVVPWTVFWERNYFLEGTVVGLLLTPHAVRGAISGVGVICLVAAIAELRALWSRRRSDDQGGDPQANGVASDASRRP
jgi:membrane-anchored protein YejM (alkaline phosphatase superfamily)